MLMSNISNPFFLKLSFHKCFNSTLQLTACLLVASPTIFFSLSLNISLSPPFSSQARSAETRSIFPRERHPPNWDSAGLPSAGFRCWGRSRPASDVSAGSAVCQASPRFRGGFAMDFSCLCCLPCWSCGCLQVFCSWHRKSFRSFSLAVSWWGD